MPEKDFAKIPIDISNSKSWKGIVWHHSASKDGVLRDWPGIVKYHTSYRINSDIVTKEEFYRRFAVKKAGESFLEPWIDVGYHGGVELVGGVPVYNAGRSLKSSGAHSGVKGCSNSFNSEYLGFCAIGDFDLKSPPIEIWNFALAVTRTFSKAFSIPPSHVIGHREVYDKLGIPREKTCPGSKWDMDLFRKEI